MKTISLPGLALMGILLTSCFTATGININNGKDSDATVKKVVKTAYFNEIQATQGIKVIVSQGEFPGNVSIATTPSAEEYLQVKVSDGKLKIYYDNKNAKGTIKGPSIITVTVPELEEANLSSGAYLLLKDAFTTTNKMEFDLSSGSDLRIENLSCPNLSIETSSGSSADVENFKGNLDADSSSGSSINIASAEGGDFEFDASSGSSISAYSVKSSSINAMASSGASVTLTGKTNRLIEKTSSGGSVMTTKLSYHK